MTYKLLGVKPEENEPSFTLLARDQDAAILIDFWATWKERQGFPHEETQHARSIARSMNEYRAQQSELRDAERELQAARAEVQAEAADDNERTLFDIEDIE
jgi:hypothetical protein